MNRKFHTIEEAVADLRSGKIVLLVQNDTRYTWGVFTALAENVTPQMVNFMITYGKGLVCVPITEDLANALRLPLQTRLFADPYSKAFAVSVDHGSTTTGISAYERAKTIRALAESPVSADDFRRPGHVFPLIAKRGGTLECAGIPEAVVDLALWSGGAPVGVTCEVMNPKGFVASEPELHELAETFRMKIIRVRDIVQHRLRGTLRSESRGEKDGKIYI